jgi:hypothetical protein
MHSSPSSGTVTSPAVVPEVVAVALEAQAELAAEAVLETAALLTVAVETAAGGRTAIACRSPGGECR